MRRAPADVAIHDDKRWTIVGLLERAETRANHVQIICVSDVRDVPAVCGKSRGYVFGKRERSSSLDRDPVAVVNPAEIGKLKMAGKRRGFAGNSLHHAAVACERIDIEIVEVLKPRLVVARAKPTPGERHSHAVGDALSQWARGGF